MKKDNDDQIEKNKRRFSGYQLNLIVLDETGPAYIVQYPHPDYRSPQPLVWSEHALSYSPVRGKIKTSY